MRFRSMLLMVLALTSVVAAQTQPHVDSAVEVTSYCSEVEKFTATSKQIVLGIDCGDATCNEKSERWRVFPNAATYERWSNEHEVSDAAYVWKRNGSVVKANITLQDDSGDWIHFTNYCFRPNGSLAEVKSTYNTYDGNLSIYQQTQYAEDGRVLKHEVKSVDLQSRKPKQIPPDFDVPPVPSIQNVKALPFYDLLSR